MLTKKDILDGLIIEGRTSQCLDGRDFLRLAEYFEVSGE
jgi:hypothetical protein